MSADFPSYEEIEAKLWLVEHERDILRETLERIVNGIPFDYDGYKVAQIATEALQRAGGDNE